MTTHTAASRTLVAGIGNIFLGDDGFGCEVVRALLQEELPADVRVFDYGIRSLDLAYALLEPYGHVIFVDAIALGGEPGSVYMLQPDGDEHDAVIPDPHSMDPRKLLAMARSLGEVRAKLDIIGCEPQDFGDEFEGRMGLSAIVASAIPHALAAVRGLIAHAPSSNTPTVDALSHPGSIP